MKKESELARSTHSLKRAEVAISQDRKEAS